MARPNKLKQNKNSMEIPQKITNRILPYDQAIPLLGIYPERNVYNSKYTCIIQKDTCARVHSSTFTIDKTGKQPKCPLTDEWIKKMGYVCVCALSC